ncbi:MAG: NAD-dependent epimerase/dehydratase family protein [Gemmatimonadaceae bacterium]|nr:NAD-dependent epimerase/dehydratase family protein [Gemmatimonadaceae bacterium]
MVTGGTGVVGRGTVTELVARGHSVVLVSRHAHEDARQWPEGVTPHAGDVADEPSLAGAAMGCDAVLHLAAIVEESAEATFQQVNVEGTRHVVREASRAGVARFVHVSSLGAPDGASAYHRSKAAGETVVASEFRGAWTICRPGNVYGPGDEQISVFLRLVRGPTPIVPLIGSGDQQFQPVWWEDVARALADVVEREDLAGRALDLAGAERTSQNDLLRRFSTITGRNLHGVAVPEFLATLGARVVSTIGWDVHFTDDQLAMLREGNVISDGGTNDLVDTLGITPTPLDTGLRQLAELQPEQLPGDGVGSLTRKRFWADITGSPLGAEQLFAVFRTHFNEVTAVFVEVAAEPGSEAGMREGGSLTLSLPMRGHVQVRAAGLEECGVTLLTLQGHPLAGAVRFGTEARGAAVRFQVEVFDRAATVIDLVAMRTLGDRLQAHTWSNVVERMIELSEGAAPDGVHDASESLSETDAEAVHRWLEEMTLQQKRTENAERIAKGGS